jgi:hypothetical protein
MALASFWKGQTPWALQEADTGEADPVDLWIERARVVAALQAGNRNNRNRNLVLF